MRLLCIICLIAVQLLFDQVGRLVAGFDQMSKTKRLDILLYGFPDNDCFDLNKEIAKVVQSYILQTKRFLMKN